MEDISSMWKYCIFIIAAIGLLAILYKLMYVIDGFIASDGCPSTSVLDPISGSCRDPDCKPGQKNTRGPSGMICARTNTESTTFTPTSQADCASGTTFDATAKSCLVCTKLGDGTTQCRSGGAYDAGKPDPKYHGSINEQTVKTDVLSTAGTISYADWLKDPKTNSDLTGSGDTGSFLGSHYTGTDNTLLPTSEDDVIPTSISSGRTTEKDKSIDKFYEDLLKRRTFSYNNNNLTNNLYKKGKDARKTAKELLEAENDSSSKIYNRFMERPSEMSYDEDADDYDEYFDENYDEYYDETEGFATRL